MATTPKKPGPSLSKADEAYQEELKRKKRATVITASVVGTCTLVLAIMLAGDYFSGILGFFGLRSLHNEQKGIYADCSKKENKNSPYCRPKVSQSDRDWKDMRDSKGRVVPFTLHD